MLPKLNISCPWIQFDGHPPRLSFAMSSPNQQGAWARLSCGWVAIVTLSRCSAARNGEAVVSGERKRARRGNPRGRGWAHFSFESAINKEHMQAIHLIRFLYPHGHKSDKSNVCTVTRTSLADGVNGGGEAEWESRGESPGLGFLTDKILHHLCCSPTPLL